MRGLIGDRDRDKTSLVIPGERIPSHVYFLEARVNPLADYVVVLLRIDQILSERVDRLHFISDVNS
jgi:hypothetical protein